MERRVYLDSAGAAVAGAVQMAAVGADLASLRLANPHSHHPSAALTQGIVHAARERVLRYLNAEDYSVVFTTGATGSLKLLAESFLFHEEVAHEPGPSQVMEVGEEPLPTPTFLYTKDAHTSVVGMREVVRERWGRRVGLRCVSTPELERRLQSYGERAGLPEPVDSKRSLVVLPGQSNFSGRRWPQSWVEDVECGALGRGRWCVCVDASALLSTSTLDLATVRPAFLVLSFYKMFGYPTGLGALLVRKDAQALLRRAYFGGGTVSVALSTRDFHVPRSSFSESMEDGTLDYYAIAALRHGFDAIDRRVVGGGMREIGKRAFALCKLAWLSLSDMRHGNGAPCAEFYLDTDFKDDTTQGPILNFNLLAADGSYIGYSQVAKIADLYGIELRTGCFCNLGACQHYLSISDDQLIQNFKDGKECGDERDVGEGRALGSVRISFGWDNGLPDVSALLAMLHDVFLDPPALHWPATLALLRAQALTLGLGHEELDSPALDLGSNPSIPAAASGPRVVEEVWVYPVKSGRGLGVDGWSVGPTGLLRDREWMVLDPAGLVLTQKRVRALATLRPALTPSRLLLRAPGAPPFHLPLQEDTSNSTHCVTKVCSQRVSALDCGDAAGAWISDVLSLPGSRLVRQTSSLPRIAKGSQGSNVSLANEAQFLLLNRSSLELLMPALEDILTFSELASRFRGNLLVSGVGPLEELRWRRIAIGDCEFKVVGECSRCQMVCVDQRTGEKSPAVLAALRRLDPRMKFGVYLEAEGGEGRRIGRGSGVRVLEWAENTSDPHSPPETMALECF